MLYVFYHHEKALGSLTVTENGVDHVRCLGKRFQETAQRI